MHKPLLPIDETYWYLKPQDITPLTQNMQVDVVVVGGGMAGLSAAQACAKRGLKVALVEKAFCGAGASGKSSGFITPDAEFSFGDLVNMHGSENAQKLWPFICSGARQIQSNIKDYSIECQYQEKDTLVVATSQRAFNKKLTHEHETRLKYGLESNLHTQDSIKNIINGTGYYGGLSYGNTFSIKAFDYCQAMKKVLQAQGVQIFEESPVTHISSSGIQTHNARIDAKNIIVATDRFLPELTHFNYDIYHVQTFLMASAPMAEAQAKKIFPGKPMMAWDTDMIYHYFRLTSDNRLLLGGADLFSTYSTNPSYHNTRVFKKLAHYAQTYFPEIKLEWEYMWPGLIGITKDIFPLAGKDNKSPHIYYIAGAAGLPWAAALGQYAADSLFDSRSDFDAFFNPYRGYLIPRPIQAIIGNKLTFALCNFQKVGSL